MMIVLVIIFSYVLVFTLLMIFNYYWCVNLPVVVIAGLTAKG